MHSRDGLGEYLTLQREQMPNRQIVRPITAATFAMITRVQGKIRGQGQHYSDGREILFVDAKKSECGVIKVEDGVRKPIRLRIGRNIYQAGLRTTARMRTVWVCSNLFDDRGSKVSLAQALLERGFSKNDTVNLEIQKGLIEIVTP